MTAPAKPPACPICGREPVLHREHVPFVRRFTYRCSDSSGTTGHTVFASAGTNVAAMERWRRLAGGALAAAGKP